MLRFPRSSSLQILWLNYILISLFTVPLSLSFFLENNTWSLVSFQLVAIIPYTSQILSHKLPNLLKMYFTQSSWTQIFNIQLTLNLRLLQASIMIQYHLRISYIDLSISSTPMRICHCPSVILVFLRQKLPQLLSLWEIKIQWLSVIAVVWEKSYFIQVHGMWSGISSTKHLSDIFQ